VPQAKAYTFSAIYVCAHRIKRAAVNNSFLKKREKKSLSSQISQKTIFGDHINIAVIIITLVWGGIRMGNQD
jgi:hypothetical protein